MPATIDLIGPKGYTHGWVYHGPGSGTRAHTSRLVSRTVRGASKQQGSSSEIADKATASLRGRKASDYQHLAAARLHSRAASLASSPSLVRHHQRLAAMHRGIANRTPGRGTRSSSKPAQPRPDYQKPIGPSIGTLGKGATQTHTLPRGANALTKEGRAKAFQAGHALPPPSKGSPAGFPVTDARSWEKARDAVGRAGSPERRAQLKALLRRTAAQYGKTAALKKSWAAANNQPGIELAVDRKHLAITSPFDLVITRSADGEAVVRHRNGGQEIGRISRRGSDGAWVAAAGGKELGPHVRQRGALLELIGTHNRAAGTPYHRPAVTPEPDKQTSPLADALGIPDMDLDAAQLATPSNGADDGPRVTGLSSGGQKIYKRLRGRGFPHARAHAFASRAQRRMSGGGK